MTDSAHLLDTALYDSGTGDCRVPAEDAWAYAVTLASLADEGRRKLLGRVTELLLTAPRLLPARAGAAALSILFRRPGPDPTQLARDEILASWLERLGYGGDGGIHDAVSQWPRDVEVDAALVNRLVRGGHLDGTALLQFVSVLGPPGSALRACFAAADLQAVARGEQAATSGLAMALARLHDLPGVTDRSPLGRMADFFALWCAATHAQLWCNTDEIERSRYKGTVEQSHAKAFGGESAVRLVAPPPPAPTSPRPSVSSAFRRWLCNVRADEGSAVAWLERVGGEPVLAQLWRHFEPSVFSGFPRQSARPGAAVCARLSALFMLMHDPPPTEPELLAGIVRAVELAWPASACLPPRLLRRLSLLIRSSSRPDELVILCLEAALPRDPSLVAGLRHRLSAILEYERSSRSRQALLRCLRKALRRFGR